jgi:hypothetical protein
VKIHRRIDRKPARAGAVIAGLDQDVPSPPFDPLGFGEPLLEVDGSHQAPYGSGTGVAGGFGTSTGPD